MASMIDIRTVRSRQGVEPVAGEWTDGENSTIQMCRELVRFASECQLSLPDNACLERRCGTCNTVGIH